MRERFLDLYGHVGLLFGGFALITGGGSLVAYGAIFFYLAVPGGHDITLLNPINALVSDVVTATGGYLLLVTLVGAGGFGVELKRHGLEVTPDDELLAEKKREWRRQKAKESDVWQLPEEDREEESIYEQLRDEIADDGLVLADDRAVDGNPPRVHGRIRNTSRVTYRNVRVTVAFVGPNGEVVDSGTAARKELPPKQEWSFDVFNRDASGAVTYRISRPEGDRPDTT